MGEIPEDIMKAALDLCRTREFAEDTQMAVARAILAERERCEKIARSYPSRDPAEDGNGYWAAEEIANAIRGGN